MENLPEDTTEDPQYEPNEDAAFSAAVDYYCDAARDARLDR